MFKNILFVVFFFSLTFLSAQTPIWQQSYELEPGLENDDDSRGVISDSTGIYLITQTWCEESPCVGIIKLNPEDGEVIFRKKYTYIPPVTSMFSGVERCLIKTMDGNYLLAGILYIDYEQSLFLLKFDTNGDSIWFKSYVGESKDVPNAIIESPEGDLFLHSDGFNNDGITEIDITKLDSEGNIIWEKQHDFSDIMFNPAHGGIALTEDQEIMLYFSGYAIEPTDNSRYAHLAKFDEEGNLLWVDRLYQEQFLYGEVLKRLPDGNFAGSVMIDSFIAEPISINNLPMITKFDKDGNILWEFIPPSIGRQYLLSMSVTGDGSILAYGKMWNPENFPENYQGWIAKISSDGELLWQRGYFLDEMPAAFFEFRDVDECPDGSLVAVGTTEVVETSNYNAWVVKLDSEGCFDADDCTGYNNLIVGTEEVPTIDIKKVEFFPNPTTTSLTILSNDINKHRSVQIIDVFGKTIINIELAPNQDKIDISLLSSGCYFVKIDNYPAVKIIKL